MSGDCVVQATPGMLVFEAVDPCRVLNTQQAITGNLEAGVPQSFLAYGTSAELADQGGQIACPNPREGQGLTPVAIAANVTAVGGQASGNGNIVAYPTDSTPPDSSLINFRSGANIANAATIKLCEGGACSADFDLLARFSDVPAIVDVSGFFYRVP